MKVFTITMCLRVLNGFDDSYNYYYLSALINCTGFILDTSVDFASA
jgi:hypothetical protein